MQHKEERPSNPKVQAPSCIPDRFCDREDGGALGRPGSRDWIRSPPRSAKRARHLLLPFRSRLHLVGAAAFRCRSITGAGTCSIITLMQAGPAQRKARSRASGSSFALVTTSPYAPSASNTDMTWLPETVNTTRAPACSSARAIRSATLMPIISLLSPWSARHCRTFDGAWQHAGCTGVLLARRKAHVEAGEIATLLTEIGQRLALAGESRTRRGPMRVPPRNS
ncbi:MAG: hypothetical protein K0S06_1379 [Microvirga sp.]|jgi:hypothetical protein|nr:hypothetical protein [Microvirga sp.]